MAHFTNTPTPLVPLPTNSSDEPLSERDVLEKLRAGLRVAEGEILDILKPGEGSRPLSTDHRDQLTRVKRRIHNMERMAHEQRIVAALHRGDRVADVWPVDLLGLIQVVSMPLSTAYRQEYKPLILESDENAVVSADPKLLRLALETLITCGLEHSLRNTPVMVYLVREVDEGTATVHVVSKGCEWHDEQCSCLNQMEKRHGPRLHFCSVVAQANRGWIAYDLQASKSLDLTLSLPLVSKTERNLTVV